MYKHILVATDGSALSMPAARCAIGLSRALGAKLTAIYVVAPYAGAGAASLALMQGFKRAVQQDARNALAAFRGMARAEGVAVRASSVVGGQPWQQILLAARTRRCDLIVMASHGRTGASRFWLGSVADGVMRAASVPVLMVRDRSEAASGAADVPFSRLLVPLDGSEFAEQALPHAIALAKLGAAEVHLLRVEEPAESLRTSVWALAPQDPDDLPDRLRRASDDLQTVIERFSSEWAPAKPTAEARAGRRVGDTITEVAGERGTDLIAMTTHGRGASRMILGSVADKVLRGTHCSVLLVRSR